MMNKFIVISLIVTLLMAVFLSMASTYYGSWAFYVLGMMLAVFGFTRKGMTDANGCFWLGLLIMLVTFAGANISGNIYSETVKILQEDNNQK